MPPPTAQPTTSGGQQSLADQLQGVSITPRNDLAVSRHVFQGRPCFVVRDPVTFAAHRFEPAQYESFVQIGNHPTLGEAFAAMEADGTLGTEDKEDFYDFVLDLHRSGLVTLPVSDHKAIYKRFVTRKKAQLRSKVMSPIFLRIPLFNPDAFFDRTIPFVGWMFSRSAVMLWALLMISAGTVAWINKENLEAPLLTVLELESLPLLWVLLIVLKVIHELGHGFACKAFGGKVPEIGVFLIAGTPAAYVDATASWGFHKVGHRIGVILSGMYFESICAAIALFVWAATPPGLVNTAAFQTVIMASVVTIAFNINPLAKFDGYYLLCDLVGIPNLRQRANDELGNWFDRIALGLPKADSVFGPVTRFGLSAYGVGAAVYRVTLVLGISIMIAGKAFAVGVAIAIVYAATTVGGALLRWARYLWFAPKTETVRARAIGVSVALIALIASGAFLVPVPGRASAPGVLAHSEERTLRAPAAGVVTTPPPRRGNAVRPGDVILTIADPDAGLALHEAETSLRVAQLELAAAEEQGLPAEIASAHAAAEQALAERDAAAERAAIRSVAADVARRVLSVEREVVIGAFVERGAAIARLGRGDWVAKIYVDPTSWADAGLVEGNDIGVYTASDPGTRLTGVIDRVSRLAEHAELPPAVAHTGGGSIVIDPSTGLAASPVVEVVIRLDAPRAGLKGGSRVWATIDTGHRTPIAAAWRGLRSLADQLATQ
ncbi:MAG: hypothetical protein AAGI53_12060 [Planctomycetota bacterium]